MNKYRKVINVKGVVQGVGFRPFIYNLAKECNLLGWVSNTSKGVIIDIEGNEKNINKFIKSIKSNPPILSKINSINIEDKQVINYDAFNIKESTSDISPTTYISPDYSICSKCKEDIDDVNNRRYKYPFTNCTNCGPRFSIIKELPYDRQFTTMNEFEMCNLCKEEYSDPTNRRFHAQPNACSVCGPKVYLIDKNNKEINKVDIFATVIKLIKDGNIFAIKGIGGFNLVCNSKNLEAIKILRERKNRPNKPLAVMAKDIDTVKKYCKVNRQEEKLLLSNKRPIILLDKIDKNIFPYNLAPNNNKVGVMLPYTPLHYLLFDNELDCLVMTSANVSGEPIIYKNDEAFDKLNGIADYFLMHNRDIYMRVDDSVSKLVLNEERVIRPGRGYIPYAIPIKTHKNILALGAELKNTISISNEKDVFISGYIGDLKNIETMNSLEKNIKHFNKTYNIVPEVIVYDKHPDFLYKEIDLKSLLKIDNKLKVVETQHHHSHIVSCMAENNVNEDVIGIVFDGTGYGDDGSIWGGEFIICNRKEFKRLGYLEYFHLPGGEKAIKEPWRIGISLLYKVFKDKLDNILPKHLKDKNYNVIKVMIDKNINCPRTSSIGRLFDGVSAILEFKNPITFEGEAAIYLENICDKDSEEVYKFKIKNYEDKFILELDNIIKGIVDDIINNKNSRSIAKKFHNTIVEATIEMAINIREKTSINTIAISGGVFQNEILFKNVVKGLNKYNFNIITHKIIPCNDSGISLGQLIIANELLKE